MAVGLLTTLALSGAGAAAGAGISGGLERLRQRRLDRTGAGKARQEELAAAARRRRTGQYGLTEAQRTQMLEDTSRAAQAARREALAGQQIQAGAMGQGRSGQQTRMAGEIERASVQAQSDAAQQINRLSQAQAQQQKAVDVALESSELDRQDMLQQRRAAARQRGALLGVALGSKLAQTGLTGAADRAVDAGPKLKVPSAGNTSF